MEKLQNVLAVNTAGSIHQKNHMPADFVLQLCALMTQSGAGGGFFLMLFMQVFDTSCGL